ncbi:MAG: secretin N-terminal domain-containing protein [Candidatus Omnitrophota bacterium]
MKKISLVVLFCFILSRFLFAQVNQELKIFKLKSSQAASLVSIVNDLKSKDGKVSFDTRTNSLIITDTSENLEKITKVIEQLDVPDKQVEIEVTVIEAKDIFLRDLGLCNGQVIVPSQEFRAILNLAKTSQNANLKSKSKIRTLSNHPARLQVTEDAVIGQEIFITSQAVITSPQRKPVGSILEVLPVVNNDNTIDLLVSPSVSNIDGGIQERTLFTQVNIQDGDSIILGGADLLTQTTRSNKVPFLGLSIRKEDSQEIKKVIIFLTAKIIK